MSTDNGLGDRAQIPTTKQVEEKPVFASDIEYDPVGGGTDIPLDEDQPWKAADAEARLARAKEQARTQQLRSNYGTL